MSVPYDVFVDAFLDKVSEYDFMRLCDDARNDLVYGYMKRAVAEFRYNCKYDLAGTMNDDDGVFDVDIPEIDLYEIIDIISEGMIVQWMHAFHYKQELLQNVLNTRDFTSYSPAELLYRVGEAYKHVQRDFANMVREYSYRHGNLTELHT